MSHLSPCSVRAELSTEPGCRRAGCSAGRGRKKLELLNLSDGDAVTGVQCGLRAERTDRQAGRHDHGRQCQAKNTLSAAADLCDAKHDALLDDSCRAVVATVVISDASVTKRVAILRPLPVSCRRLPANALPSRNATKKKQKRSTPRSDSDPLNPFWDFFVVSYS